MAETPRSLEEDRPWKQRFRAATWATGNGRHNTLCPPAQMERFVDRALQLGKPVQIEWFEAGHAITAQVEQSIRDQERMLDFVPKVLASAG